MRVLLLSTDLQPGGLPLRLARLAPRLAQAGIEPIVGCLARRGPLNDELESSGIETFSCDACSRLDVSCLWRLARRIRRANPDLIHSSLFHANLAARLVGRLDRNRPIVTGSVTIEIERSWHLVLESLTRGLSDLHVANSRAVADHLTADLGFPRDKVLVVPNAIDFDEIDAASPIQRQTYGIPAHVPLIVWAGRMDPVKDLDTLVTAIEQVSARMSVRAVLLGDGPERPRVQKLIEDKRLDGVITLARWSNDVVRWLKAADVLVLTSLSEGSPNVVLEAMAAGCAVLASNIPALREMIADGVTGWLCTPRRPADFADQIERVVRDPRARAGCCAAACKGVQGKHDAQAVVRQWFDIYEMLVGNRPKPDNLYASRP